MNMQRRQVHQFFGRTADDKPAWGMEILKALLIAVLVWLAHDFLASRGIDEHRLTTLEADQSSMKGDITEIKQDVKTILRQRR